MVTTKTSNSTPICQIKKRHSEVVSLFHDGKRTLSLHVRLPTILNFFFKYLRHLLRNLVCSL